MTTSRGIDVSAYQPAQDWKKHKAGGVAFAFIKATEGEHTVDSWFARHAQGAKSAGLIIGGYHFGWPTQSVATEAANYIRAVKPFAGGHRGFVHWLDLEAYTDRRNIGSSTPGHIHSWAVSWVAAVRKAYPGDQVGIYAGNEAYSKKWVPTGPTYPAWYPNYPWTHGTYAQAEAHARISEPYGKSKPLFWQFTGSPLDRSICYLSPAALKTWALNTPIAPVKPPHVAPVKPVTHKPMPVPPKVWTVKAGQTLGAIALSLGCSLASVVAYNHIKDPDVIYPGQRVTAPPVAPPVKKV